MAEVARPSPSLAEGIPAAGTLAPTSGHETATKQRPLPLSQIYTQPAPVRTFPLPSFYPNNPLSLLHIAYAWLSQVFSPPPTEPSVIHQGIWDANTRSVHITDSKSMRALWEQGFYGKGSLSRSEPNWFKGEQIRLGLVKGSVSEQHTAKRREERKQAKWERARTELEAIDKIRSKEAEPLQTTVLPELSVPEPVAETSDEASTPSPITNGVTPKKTAFEPADEVVYKPPVGPLELLALPNSHVTLEPFGKPTAKANGAVYLNGHATTMNGTHHSPESPQVLPQSGSPDVDTRVKLGELDDSQSINGEPQTNGHVKANGHAVNGGVVVNSSASPDGSERPTTPTTVASNRPSQPMKRRKSVRFSPNIQSTTFDESDPPNPQHFAAPPPPTISSPVINGSSTGVEANLLDGATSTDESSSTEETPAQLSSSLTDREHLQLSPEEAFFLVFAFGTLSVIDGENKAPISAANLFALFRSHSYFPPRRVYSVASSTGLRPDDPFLLQYVVYHHFRSLGWVVRDGIKFGTDWLLYQRGPPFDHAEFGAIVMPAYSDTWWRDTGQQAPDRTWNWLHGVNRSLSHVFKSLVLVYVDIPPPPAFNAALGEDGRDIATALKMYKVRDIMVRRWSSNRNRA